MVYALLILLALGAAPEQGAEFNGAAQGMVERVIDGDTVKMRVAIWLDQEIIVSVRVADIDAPELFRPKCAAERALALEAKKFVERFLADGEVTLIGIAQDKYAGRVVARIEAAGGDLGAALVAAKLAVADSKGTWCS